MVSANRVDVVVLGCQTTRILASNAHHADRRLVGLEDGGFRLCSEVELCYAVVRADLVPRFGDLQICSPNSQCAG